MANRTKGKSRPVGIPAPSSLLLKKINETRAKTARKAKDENAKERPVDAPPESSPESSENEADNGLPRATENVAPEDISDVSDDEPRGDIKPSSFGKTTNRPAAKTIAAAPKQLSRRPALLLAQSQRGRGSESVASSGGYDSAASNASNSNSSSRGTKRPRGGDGSQRSVQSAESGQSAKSVDLAAKTIDFGRGIRAPRQGYGATRKPSSQTRPAFKKPPTDESSESDRKPESKSASTRLKNSRSVTFKPPPAALTENSPPRRASKRADAKTATFKHSKYNDDASDDSRETASKKAGAKAKENKPAKAEKSKFKKSKYSMSSDEERDKEKEQKKAKVASGKNKASSTRGAGIYGRRKTADGERQQDKEEEKPPPRAVFRMPTYDAAGLGPDVDVPAFDDDDDDDKAKVDDAPQRPVCPLCKKPVDDDTVRALLPGHYLLTRPGVVRLIQLTFDEKVMFCAGHKQRASQHAWTARGYPAIDWGVLPARLEPHFAHVRAVLLGGASVYRDSYEGEGPRDEAVPGYYGRRGQQLLSAAIIQRLSDVLRRRAIEDPLVAARGMAQYVQAVLVPELAVQLIREDMGGLGTVTAAEGRRILGESAAIGEAVMEEEGDVVAEESEEEYESEYESDSV